MASEFFSGASDRKSAVGFPVVVQNTKLYLSYNWLIACSKINIWPWQSVEALQNKGLVKTLNTVSYH